MQNPRLLNLLINIAGALVGLAVVGYVVYAALHTELERPCSERYPAATRFSLATSEGKPLSEIGLQARTGLHNFGVTQNAAVVPVEGAPVPDALEVKLRDVPNVTVVDELRGTDRLKPAFNGIVFRWSPPSVEGASAACLAYSLRLADKFPFGGGGILPGMFGRPPGTPAHAAAGDQFAVTPQWDGEGRPTLGALLEGGIIRRVSGRAPPLPTDRWIKVEQEVILNDPGTNNGTVRLWIDGELAVEDNRAPLRKDAATLLSGVLADVGYRRAPPEPGTLRLSPFEISVK